MKKLFVLFVLAFVFEASAQYQSDREIANWNWNFGKVNVDTFCVKVGTNARSKTLVLAGTVPSRLIIIQATDAKDASVKFYGGANEKYWKIVHGLEPLVLRGANVDTLFFACAQSGTDSTHVQVLYSSWK